MKGYFSSPDLAIWLALIAGKIILCLCALRKHLFRRMPYFSSYVFASTAKSVALLSIFYAGSYTIYYYAFYGSGYIVSLLAFLALLESGRRVLPGLDLPRKEKAFGLLFVAIAGVIAFAWLWPLRFIENRIEITAQLVIGIGFVFIAAYSRYLGLYWSRLVAGVTVTLGSLYLVQATADLMMAHYGPALVLPVRLLSQIANLLAVVTWIVVILSPWGERKLTEEGLRKIEEVLAIIEASLRTAARIKPL
jgi:hypothetical protein